MIQRLPLTLLFKSDTPNMSPTAAILSKADENLLLMDSGKTTSATKSSGMNVAVAANGSGSGVTMLELVGHDVGL